MPNDSAVLPADIFLPRFNKETKNQIYQHISGKSPH